MTANLPAIRLTQVQYKAILDMASLDATQKEIAGAIGMSPKDFGYVLKVDDRAANAFTKGKTRFATKIREAVMKKVEEGDTRTILALASKIFELKRTAKDEDRDIPKQVGKFKIKHIGPPAPGGDLLPTANLESLAEAEPIGPDDA